MNASPRPPMRPPLPTATSKADLRTWARATRDATSPAERAVAAAAIARLVDERHLAALPSGAVVALYAAMRSELDLRALDDAARARGLAVAYPRIVRGDRLLRFHLAGLDELRAATFGVPEPDSTAPAVAPSALALVVVPGLAFTAAGARLGWGAGHYDATLAAVAGRIIGVSLAALVVDELPETPHDRRMDEVVTELGVAGREARP